MKAPVKVLASARSHKIEAPRQQKEEPEISGDNFRFLFLLPWGFNFMEMQALRTTLTSEDFSDNSLIEQGLVKNPPPVVPVCS